jgi:hypothetical protein
MSQAFDLPDDRDWREGIAGCPWCDEEGWLHAHDGSVAQCSHQIDPEWIEESMAGAADIGPEAEAWLRHPEEDT